MNKIIFQVGNASAIEFHDIFCANNNIEKSNAMHISYLEYFENYVARQISGEVKFKDVDTTKNKDFANIEKTFLSLNHRIRSHRINLLLLFNHHNILKNSLFTMIEPSPDMDPYMDWYDYFDEYFIEKYNITTVELDKLRSLLPMRYDDTHDSDVAFLTEGMRDLHNKTLISVVTETTFNHDIFLTEKIFKPIAYRQPFILVGAYKSLAHLKSLGYKTFSDYFDESYDEVSNYRERLDKIAQICSDINSWSIERKEAFFYDTMDITEHNYQLLQSQNPYRRKNFWDTFK